MKVLCVLILTVVCLSLTACGGPPGVTVVNECDQKVDVQVKSVDGGTWDFSAIKAGGTSSEATIGLGPMDVTAVFPEGSVEAVTGFKAEEGFDYVLTIRGDPPGIFVTPVD